MRFFMSFQTVIGIDVSKDTLDFHKLPTATKGTIKNTPRAINAFIESLAHDQPEMVIFEATGGYQNQLAEALFKAGIPLKAANPKQIRDFARSLGRLGKTDSIDAEIIARFAQSRELKPDQPKAPQLLQISELLLRREQLITMITMEKGHRENTRPTMKNSIDQHIKMLQSQILELDKGIRQLVVASEETRGADEILRSIPGVGPITAAVIIAEMPELTSLRRKQAAALAGVAPFNRDSGQYRGQRHISGGRKKVRNILYCIMRTCLIHNPVVKKWYEGFRAKGKAYKVAVIACVRKLLMVMRAMLISNSTWDIQKHPFSIT
ncbi:IS110 family transposase [Deltaproteobacteria bacterium Smac51]|nr:IS110 family transposase [Deltaproteobacteria bacterium Smac51]UQZ89020.1 IS110 family transposase [Deltaproteobacteria bacterium Smac51]UQZ89170.1 IS110 family transposase [Deltaproteobacteria bacterium Smac51]UQZ89219.1 IS110 family transposase [Deltaproteobacteria bacterium Smac51]UQZ89940.1 IS110 family transposase [Deltaproteobacteria bacterium Smac51]